MGWFAGLKLLRMKKGNNHFTFQDTIRHQLLPLACFAAMPVELYAVENRLAKRGVSNAGVQNQPQVLPQLPQILVLYIASH